MFGTHSSRQKPKRTFVKYQNADVNQSDVKTAKRIPPATGSIQPGNARLRTISTFTAKTP